MMLVGSTYTKKIFLAAFFALLLVTPIISLEMLSEHHHNGAPMSDCPFMPGEMMACDMSALSHLHAWQALFASLPADIAPLTILVLLLVLALWAQWMFNPPDQRWRRSVPCYAAPLSSKLVILFLFGHTVSPRAP